MANQYVQVQPNSTGIKVDTSELTVGANTVSRQRMVIADDATAAALGAVQNSAVAGTEYGLVVRPIQAALTKGTQGTTGISTQDLKDSGRVNLVFYATEAASGTTTTETAISLTKAADTGATSAATSFVITSGKRFRITSITFGSQGNVTATLQKTIFKLRINTAGSVSTSSTPLVLQGKTATAAVSLAYDRFIVPIPDGLEFLGNGTIQFGVTAAATFTTNAPTWDVIITGFEY